MAKRRNKKTKRRRKAKPRLAPQMDFGEEDPRFRKYIREQLSKGANIDELSAWVKEQVVPIADQLAEKKPVPDRKGFIQHLQKRLDRILLEEIKALTDDSEKRIERVKQAINTLGNQQEAITDEFREGLKELSRSELTDLMDSVTERFGPDDAKSLKDAIEEAALTKEASADVEELMATGMTEAEAIERVLHVDQKDGMGEPLAVKDATAFWRDRGYDEPAYTPDIGISEERFRELLRELRLNTDNQPSTSFIVSGQDPPDGGQFNNPQEFSVAAYMEALHTAYILTKAEKDHGRRRDAIRLWTLLREARVFHIEPETYDGVYREVDRHLTTDIAGFVYYPPEAPPANIPEEEKLLLRLATVKATKDATYPEKFPFPCVFLGYGTGLNVPKYRIRDECPPDIREGMIRAILRGHLLTDDGFAIALISVVSNTSEGVKYSMWFNPLRETGPRWPRRPELDAWVLPVLINIITDHRTFIIDNKMATRQRKQFKQDRKKMGIKGHTPPPYYTLKIKHRLVTEKVRKTMPTPRSPVTYRTDVSAHERCRIKRGHLPIDAELAAKLKRREYKIFTHQALDAETLHLLMERGQPFKRSDEWLAIKVSWIEKHMTCNDESLPYIPAVRKLGDVRTSKPSAPTGSWADDPGA